MNIFRAIKSKRKSKRDQKMLELYGDWPPDRVDEFLAWQHAGVGSQLFWAPAPKDYNAWKRKVKYNEYVTSAEREPLLMRR